MARFIVVTFAVLAFVFYEMSGGADFEPGWYIEADARQDDRASVVSRAAVSPVSEPVVIAPLATVNVDTVASAPPASTPAELEAKLDVALAETRLPATPDQQVVTLQEPEVLAALSANSASLLEVGVIPTDSGASGAFVSLSGLSAPAGDIRADDATPIPADPFAAASRTPDRVTGTRVNMREGPGTEFNVISQLVRGDAVEVMYDAGDGWVQLRDIESDQVGWMSARFVGTATD